MQLGFTLLSQHLRSANASVASAVLVKTFFVIACTPPSFPLAL